MLEAKAKDRGHNFLTYVWQFFDYGRQTFSFLARKHLRYLHFVKR